MRYTSCKGTVQQEASSGMTPKMYFGKRYAKNSMQRRSLDRMLLYLKQLQEQVPNVFLAAQDLEQGKKKPG